MASQPQTVGDAPCTAGAVATSRARLLLLRSGGPCPSFSRSFFPKVGETQRATLAGARRRIQRISRYPPRTTRARHASLPLRGESTTMCLRCRVQKSGLASKLAPARKIEHLGSNRGVPLVLRAGAWSGSGCAQLGGTVEEDPQIGRNALSRACSCEWAWSPGGDPLFWCCFSAAVQQSKSGCGVKKSGKGPGSG